MNYKIGDIVTIQQEKPTSHLVTEPGWNSMMSTWLGKTVKIECITARNTFRSGEWYFHFDWVEQKPTLSLEERIINKAKELDKKWKERTTQCA